MLLAAAARLPAFAQEAPAATAAARASISLTAPDIELGQLLTLLSQRTGRRVMCEPQLSGLHVSILGAEGSASELIAAVVAATGLKVRDVGGIIYLARNVEGAAAVAHRHRRGSWPRLSTERSWLAMEASTLARAALGRMQVLGVSSAQEGLTPQQRMLLARQGFLTVADLFPEYYQPMYDIFGNLIDQRSDRPASLPEFAGARVFLQPSLQMILSLPVREGASDVESALQTDALPWTINLGSY